MATPQRAKDPFQFCTQFHLEELTGLRAATIPQLLHIVRQLPGSSIYYHTHQYVLDHQLVVPEPSNSFASWVRQALNETVLAEQLATIDTVHFPSIRALRRRLIIIMQQYVAARPIARMIFARSGEEFHAVKTISVEMPTAYVAQTLQEFYQALHDVSIESIYFHLFEARLRLSRPTNDFSAWLDDEFGETDLAQQFDSLNPYASTLEELRTQLLERLRQRLAVRD